MLMIGYPIKNGSQHEWYHLPCLTNVVAKSRSKSFPPDVSGFVGYESLSETDQELVKSLVLRRITRRPRPISKKRAREEMIERLIAPERLAYETHKDAVFEWYEKYGKRTFGELQDSGIDDPLKLLPPGCHLRSVVWMKKERDKLEAEKSGESGI